MRSHSMVVGLAGALLLAACSSISDAGPTGPFTLSVPDPWPGSTVYVSSADFRRGITSATLRVDTFTVQLTPSNLNDSTLSGTLPSAVSGEVVTELTVDGVRFPTRPLQIAGYLDTRIIPKGAQSFVGTTYVWPQTGEAQLVGSDLGGDLTILNLDHQSFRTVARHENTALRGAGPGRTYLPGVFLFRRVAGALESWDLSGIGTNLGAHPELPPVANNEFLSLTTQLGPNAWIVGDEGDYHYFIRRPDAGGAFTIEYSYGAYYGVQFSPRGDRAAGLGSAFVPDGAARRIEMPVYALPAVEVAFRLKVGRVGALGFSPDGAMLTVAGSDDSFYQYKHLQFVDATTGAVRADTLLGGTVVAIASDPLRPLIYVAMVNGSGPPTVLAYSATTFRLLYRLNVPDLPAGTLLSRGESAAIAFSLTRGMYLYVGDDAGGNARVYRFALPSVQ